MVVLAPPIEGEEAALQALLGDGAAWSTSALALALGESQRTVQRALGDLEAAGKVRSIGSIELTPEGKVHWCVKDGPPEWVGTEIEFRLSQEGSRALGLSLGQTFATCVFRRIVISDSEGS